MKTPDTMPEAAVTLCLLDCAEYHTNRAEEYADALKHCSAGYAQREGLHDRERIHRDFATACKLAAARGKP